MEQIRVDNAVIEGTTLGFEDHGIFTIMMDLKFGAWNQGFGGYSLDKYIEEEKKRVAVDGVGVEMIKRILAVAGVDSWEKLKGKPIRVTHTSTQISAITHLLDDKITLDLDTFFPDYNTLYDRIK